MKHLKTYEGSNTSYWYSRTQSTTDKEEFMKAFLKIVTNPNVEEIKLIDFKDSLGLQNSCSFFIYTSKSEKEKNFKGWNQTDDIEKRLSILKRIGGREYANEEIDDWLDEWETRNDANKFNL